MKLKKISAVLLSLAVVASAALSTGVMSASANPAVDDCHDDWLHAEGDKLYDMYGNEVWITGANWFGFNCTENILHGLWSAELRDTLKSIADHGVNMLRIPVSTELLYGWMQGTPAACVGFNPSNSQYYKFNAELCNADGTAMNSMQVFDKMMEVCKEYGIKVMVDVHSPDSNNTGHNYELWYGKEMKNGVEVTTQVWIDTWVWLVNKYKDDDTLIAVDLKNEPHGKGGSSSAKWDNSTDENNWKYAAETCAKAILKVNPNILIMVEGVEVTPVDGSTYETANGNYNGGWWGGNLRGVKKYPLELGEHQSQLVYSPHDYGPLVFAQTWFDKDFTTQTLLDDYWYDAWAYIDAEGIAPLLMGEWGGTLDGGKNEKWLNLLKDYMIKNRINHTFWCINPNSGDTGGLLKDDFKTWDSDKYAIYEQAVWQTDDGVFIGLDHKTAIGENGISLNEYYGENGEIIWEPKEPSSDVDTDTNKPVSTDKETDTDTNKPVNTDTDTNTDKDTDVSSDKDTDSDNSPSTDTDSSTGDNTDTDKNNQGIDIWGADVNHDGRIDVLDIVIIRSYIVNGI